MLCYCKYARDLTSAFSHAEALLIAETDQSAVPSLVLLFSSLSLILHDLSQSSSFDFRSRSIIAINLSNLIPRFIMDTLLVSFPTLPHKQY